MSRLCSRILIKTTGLLTQTNVIRDSVNRTITRRYASGMPGNKKGVFKLGLVGVTVGALVGTGYSIRQLNKPNTHIINEQITIPVLEEVPKINPSRQVSLRRSKYTVISAFQFTDQKHRRPERIETYLIPISNLSILLQSPCVSRLLRDFLRCN